MRNKWLVGTGIAVLSVLVSVSVAYAALTFTTTAVTSDGALTLTTGAAGTAVTVTYGISANAATTTDSLYVGGLLQHTGGTASATALVIGGDVPLYRSAANTLKIAGSLANATTTDSLYVGGLLNHTGGTASGTALVIGADVPLFRNAANQLRLQGTLSVSAGVAPNAATTTDSLYVGGLLNHTGGTASGTALVIGADVPLFRNAANQLRLQGGLSAASATTTDSLYSGGVFRSILSAAISTTTPSSTRSLIIGAPAGTATTTLSFGNASGSQGSCIEMHREQVTYRIHIVPSSSPSIAGYVLAVTPGSCRD